MSDDWKNSPLWLGADNELRRQYPKIFSGVPTKGGSMARKTTKKAAPTRLTTKGNRTRAKVKAPAKAKRGKRRD